MNQEIFPTHASIFVDEALEKLILDHYDLRRPLECRFFRQGLNDTYLVRSGGDDTFLRVYRHGWRTGQEIEAELAFINHMRAAHLPLSYPIQRRDGSYVHQLTSAEGTRFAVLFSAAKGEMCKNPSPDQAYSFGRLAAQMHANADKHADTYNRFSLDASYLVEEPLASIRATFGHLHEEMDLADALARQMSDYLGDLSADADYGFCHGDLHTENVHFDADDRPTLFDCDCCGYGWRAYDIATFLWSRYLFEPDEESRQRSWSHFLAGYVSIRATEDDTRDRLLPFVIMRQLWVMGIHTGAATRHYGRRWLDRRYVSRHFGLLRRFADELP